MAIRRRDVKINFLLLGRGFFSVGVTSYLRRAGHGFLILAVPRGRKSKGRKKPAGLRAL